MSAEYATQDTVDWLVTRWDGWVPDVGVVLGSGIELIDDRFQELDRLPVTEIPGLPCPSVSGHGGNWIRYQFQNKKILVLGGRVHLYEGYQIEAVTRAIRVLSGLGTGAVLLTNAAGGIGQGLSPGTVVAITDHLQLQGVTSLVSRLESHLPADRQPVYDVAWIQKLDEICQAISIEALPRGVYASLIGPVYETPSEIKMLKKLGADLVGMSTVPEAIAARSVGMRVLGLSLVTNLAAGISSHKLDHQEVLETGKKSQQRMVQIVGAAIEALD